MRTIGVWLVLVQVILMGVLLSTRAVSSRTVSTRVLIEELRTPGAVAWNHTVRRLGARGAAVVPALISALGDPHRAVREGAAHALGDIGPAAASAIDALLVAFEDEDDFVRWKAARALGNIGPAAARALGPLRRALSPLETEVVKAHAKRAIERIEGGR